jgi:hypothetical protein
MDAKNPYETPTTYRLHRAEYLFGFAVVTAMIVLNFGDIRWVPFIALFLYIDIIGYIPGAIAFHRSKTKRIHKAYYVSYNIMHSLVTQGALMVGWVLLFGWEWALLAIPFHLFGDRGLFGNFLKPFNLPFEPHRNPAYDRLLAALGYPATPDGKEGAIDNAAEPIAAKVYR